MDEKKKRLILFIGALFVAVIFLTSYAAFSNNNNTGTSTSTSTIANLKTVAVIGTTNGIISNYTDVAFIYVGRMSNESAINETLNALEANGTISNYVGTNTSYDVLLTTINPYELYQKIMNKTVNISVGGQAEITLPKQITVYYSSTGTVPITLPTRNYTILLNKTRPINSTIGVKITAIITTNGSVYNNNIHIQAVQS